MSLAREQSENQLEFESLLQRAKELTLGALSEIENPSSLSGSAFENLVHKQTEKAALGGPYEGRIRRTADRAFPDIVVADFFGIEVKATKKNDWASVGNSVLESSRESDVEKIYVLFGKLGGTPDIRYKDYEACLKEIKVTHYPRYQIDMELRPGESIFGKMGVSYDEIRSSKNPVKTIRKYYRGLLEEGEGLWWIDDDLDTSATTDPVIKKLSLLPGDQQDSIKADVFVRFPEVFSSSTKKFTRVPPYLASAHSVLSPNLRDFFTSKGQVDISYQSRHFKAPRIIGETIRLFDKITNLLSSMTKEELEESWAKSISNFTTPVEAWLAEVDKQTAHFELPIEVSKLLEHHGSEQD